VSLGRVSKQRGNYDLITNFGKSIQQRADLFNTVRPVMLTSARSSVFSTSDSRRRPDPRLFLVKLCRYGVCRTRGGQRSESQALEDNVNGEKCGLEGVGRKV
jgi:hypothetical protein